MVEWTTPVERLDRLGDHLGIELLAARDDLLPFPLAGNKVRKLTAELDTWPDLPHVVITNGGVTSNHCRTLAFLGAARGFAVHLVLHGETDVAATSLAMVDALGATWTTGPASSIKERVAEAVAGADAAGQSFRIVPGGCHTAAGARAYRAAAAAILTEHKPDWVVLASGTGATHGGIAAAAHHLGAEAHVVGFSVARSQERGRSAVVEAATWAGVLDSLAIDFRDTTVDGGYAVAGERTGNAVALGWRFGLPVDATYTGKALAGLLELVESGEIRAGERVLFWHTGGLVNALEPAARGRRASRKTP